MNVSAGMIGSTCPTCHGWSCLQCAEAVAHDVCRRDCPSCYDYRVLPEEPWLPAGSHDHTRTARARARKSARQLSFAQSLAEESSRNRTRTRARRARLHAQLVAV